MKILLAIIGLFVAFGVNADAQINQQTYAVHFPFDRDDTDREFKFSPLVSGLIQDQDLRSIRATVIHKHLCTDLPDEIAALAKGGTLTVESNQDNDGEACNVTDTDGNAIAADEWAVRATMLDDYATQVSRFNICEVQHKIWCRLR